jgi:phosphoglycolate phosphatase (TIGR01487 family)
VHYVALACDYDGTLATEGRVPDHVVDALRRVSSSGRKLILVTGRQIDELETVFDHLDLFDRIVAENGGVLYDPTTKDRRPLAEAPPDDFIEALRARGVDEMSVGEVIVATWEPHDAAALDAIKELGLEREIIFNKGAVMVLPSGVNKATGLEAALDELGMSARNVVGVGDAENDHAFVELAALGVAVANAIPALRDRADHVTDAERGDGVVELIERLLDDDLEELDRGVARHQLEIGRDGDDDPVWIDAYRSTVLVMGASGSGKSTLTTGLLELLTQRGFQFCLIDPEGDYDELEPAVTIGGPKRAPTTRDVVELLDDARTNVVVNLLGVRLDERPGEFGHLLGHLESLRADTGRPHWLVIDEAHHLMPPEVSGAFEPMPQDTDGVVMVTVHPELMAPEALRAVDIVISTAKQADEALAAFAERAGVPAPMLPDDPDDRPVVWKPGQERAVRFSPPPPTTSRRRHLRKYAEGDLADRSFVFVGPEDRLSLRAHNLVTFAQMARGVDDDTWRFHLARGDFERWFRDTIKDDDLAEAAVHAAGTEDPSASRDAVLEAIEDRYTLPA